MTQDSVVQQKPAKARLVRRGPSPLALEQRFMFDGAAVGDAIDTIAHAGQALDGASPHVATAETALPAAVVTARADAEKLIADYLSQPEAKDQLFALFNGGLSSPSAQWQSTFDQLLTDLRSGDDAVRIELRSGAELQGAKGAFSTSGTTGQHTIYLNADWLAGDAGAGIGPADGASIESVLVEELGHSLDARLNGGADTAGDEGQRFADVLLNGADPYGIDASAAQDDHGTVQIDGRAVEVEFASYTFVNAYEMVYDRNNNSTIDGFGNITGGIDTNERWADKEQNLHYFNSSVSLGQVQVNDGSNGINFSGNDVSATSIVIGGNTYYGWISRPIKANGVVRGFYFWTDRDFTDFATAQADGNQDGDSKVLDNRGFLLVVDQAWFDQQIVDTRGSSTVNINNAKDGNLGNVWVADVGSSSDRVDSALNALLPTYVPAVAVDDLANGVPDTSGGAALEQGYDANTSAVLVAGIDATGNVLANDTANGNTLNVVSTGKSVANQLVAAASTSASNSTTVSGLYGSLTIGADGSYRYVVDNSNSTVNALQVGNSLTETFEYTLTDNKGGTSSATLTVQINGSNDAPVAKPDYNSAKESTTAAVSGFDSTGYSATGNVLPKDTDVDDKYASGDFSISGIFGSGLFGSYTSGGTNTTLTFSGNGGFSAAVGDYLYTDTGTTKNYVLYDASSNAIRVTGISTDASGNQVFTFSGQVDHYVNGSNLAYSIANGSKVGFYQDTSKSGNNLPASKVATVGTSTTTNYSTVTLDSTSGTVAAGMTAYDSTNSVLGKVTAVTTSGPQTVVTLDQQIGSAPSGTITFKGVGSDIVVTGANGTLVLNYQGVQGSYRYTPKVDNPNLSSGQSVVDVFDYTMNDSRGATSTSRLYITVYGSGASDPVLADDSGTAKESGVQDGGNTVEPGSTASGNVLTNDAASTGRAVASYSLQDGSSVTAAGGGLTGSYGTLTITSAGAFTYSLDNTKPAVNALPSGSTLSETFRYKVTNSAGGTSWANLVITINGTNDVPVANGDAITVTSGQLVASGGNVLGNDMDVDTGDTKTLTQAEAGSTAAPGTTVSGPTSIAGSYGILTIGPDGSYSYAIDEASAAVKALAAGATTSETFSYRMQDSQGATSVATLTVTVVGRNDAPVNTVPVAVSTDINTGLAFTGGNAISVADVDGNLNEVVLHVDHGTLSASGSGAAVITGAGSGDLKISGTQAEINAVLASLGYLPETGFTGTDYLTIFSRDSNGAYDSDGFAINIPTVFAGPTVLESDLASGSNASGTGETGSTTLTAPSGQNFGSGTQSGSGSYGSWMLDAASGLFTYTLSSAPNISGSSTTDSVNVITYDAFGNVTTNTVVVAITDDVPAAVGDSGSVISGATTSGNVQGNDVFGADGPKKDGSNANVAVVGVASGSDTSSPVSGQVGTQISGSYGKLTLNADGSYAYVANTGVTGSPTDSFVYTISDSDGDLSTVTLVFAVTPAGVPTADLVTTKTLYSSDATPDVGDTVSFLITVTNNGADTATNVRLTDQLPAGLSYTGAIASLGSYDSGTGIWTIGTLANGASATLRLSATVDAAADGTSLTNTTGKAISDQSDPSDAGNDLTETVVVDRPPVASNDSAGFTPGSVTTIDVLANDTSGDAVVASTVVFTDAGATDAGKTLVVAGEGTWSINTTTGAITFTPLAGFTGNPTAIEYRVADAQGNVDTATVTLAKGAADLVTAKTLYSSDATPDVGDTVSFLITVTNNGADTATNVRLTDQLPAGLSYTGAIASLGSYDSGTGIWTIGTLANGASATLRLSATVDAAADGTSLTNTTGKAISDQSDPSDAGNDLTETVVVDRPPVASNDSAGFTPGSATTINVLANDTGGDAVVPGTVVFTDAGATDAGKTLVVAGEGTWRINVSTGAITFTPLAGFTGNPTAIEYRVADAQGNVDTATVTLAKGAADLVTAKTLYSSDATPDVGDTVSFLITVTNNGADTATNVRLTDQLPSGLSFAGAIASLGSYDSGTGIWTIGTLANGASATLRLSATVDAAADGTSLTNTTGKAISDQSDPSDAGNDLTETVVVDRPPVASNDSASFTPGSATTIDVLANDTGGDAVVPGTVVFTDAGATDAGKTLVVAGEGTWRINASTGAITFTPLAGFTGNPTAIEYRVADAQGNVDTATVTLAKGAADLVTAKTLYSSDATPDVGDTVSFLITVTNNGADTATNVRLTDQLPAGLSYTGAIASLGSYDSGTGIWTIGTLANGASATLRLSGTVDAAADGTSLTNTTGKAISDQSDPSDAGNDLTETVVVDRPPVASNDSAGFTPGSATTIDVLANDTGGDAVLASTVVFTDAGATDAGKTLVVAGEGTWSINATTGAITFTPLAGFTGNPTAIEYRVADAQGNVDTATVTLAKGAADLVTAKTLYSSDATPDVGDTVSFLITVTNNGADTATNVRLTDQLPSGLSYAGAIVSLGSYDSGTGIWTIGTLANGASATLRLSGTVDAAADGTSLTNTTGKAISDQSDPSDAGNDLTETVVVDRPPVASNDSAGFTPGSATTVDVLANDTGGDAVLASTVVFTDAGATDAGKALVVAGEGTWSINTSTGAITFTPLAGFTGNPTAIEYRVADAQGNVDTATVTLAKGGDQPNPPLPTPPVVAPEPPVAPAPPAEPVATPPDALPQFDSAVVLPVSPLAPPSLDSAIASIVQDAASLQAGKRDASIGDIYTSPAGFRVVVIEAPQANLSIYRGVADQYADVGSSTAFAVPYDAFAHTDPSEQIMLSAMLSDGRKLPNWIVFDAQSGKFTVIAPKDFKGELKIKVIARDSHGHEVSTLFRFSVGEKQSGATGGRQAFSDQLRFAGKRQALGFLVPGAHDAERLVPGKAPKVA